ncbi:MAG: alcohol dehydrogenase catalytic domain-containing protein, partial [Thermoanaerobaculia bacterium]
MNSSFRALLAEKTADGYTVAFRDLTNEDLPAGDLLVDVAYSSLNYKDGLAVTGSGRIIRKFPMVPGIDLAGTVLESTSDEFRPGDRVVAVGQGLGEQSWGGYTQRQRLAADALVALPPALSPKQAMQIGTAGFTAMLCVMALERAGVAPSERPVIVTGAAGGVGSIAVLLLTGRGFK